ncbi:MAG: hypothetical protein PHV17_04015 [Candidatus Omnitrophica bacterium]|nr:hypothetical protein [Candidatus Omnitrophota bacterium]
MGKKSIKKNKKRKVSANSPMEKIDKSAMKKKKPYTLMSIAKIRLNPEQAVLSCCNAVFKVGVVTLYGQCGTTVTGCPTTGGDSWQDLSS